MSDFPRWKYALVVVVLLFAILYGLPNIYPPQPAVQISANQGATVDQTLEAKVKDTLQEHKVRYADIAISDTKKGKRLLVRLDNTEIQLKASDALKSSLGDKYVVALNLASTVPSWLRSIGADAMPLGLDLQGGVHFLLQVDQQGVRDNMRNTYVSDIRTLLRDKKIRYESVNSMPDRNAVGVRVVLRSDADRDQAAKDIGVLYPDLDLRNGSSRAGSSELIVSMTGQKVRELAQGAITQNVATLRNRINALGVSEPLIQQQGDNRIIVELAGVQDTAEAKKILGAQATLEYRAGLGTDAQAADAARTGVVPPEARLYYMRGTQQPVLLSKQVIATGDQLVNASSGFDQQNGTPNVSVTLNAAAAKKMLDYTSANVGHRMGVVYIDRVPETKKVDGKDVTTYKTTQEVINYATINGVFGAKFETSGLDSPQQAAELALLLKGGSLAASMDIVEQAVISASLGQDNIQKGVKAVLIGLALVLLAAAFYYKLFGLVADIALTFNLVLLLAIMSIIPVTLTMPGIAGIVLTLGMAIDANVLICERVREELRNGSTPLASIRAGYEKAWATILDANVTHLLAALALMTMGSGPIRGFGITLFIGILTSMFTSVTATHAITALIHGHRKLKTLSV